MLQQIRHEAPRPYYGPRSLIDAAYGKKEKARAYGKRPDAPRGALSLPEAWSVVCPNRITERRLAAGMEHVTDLERAIGCISYQRLVKMEMGRVIIRDSEYELVADALGLVEDDLKLPLLTHGETVEWSRRWGSRTYIEEGGDEDSVLLAAYVRHLVKRAGRARAAICQEFGAPGNCLAGIWYAEKPIDRWPDSTMTVVIKLARVENWDQVILASRALNADRALDREIAEVVKPRIRYAPEDPDRKAPWTYEADPFRTRKAKRQVVTPLSAPMLESAKERKIREKRELEQAKADRLEMKRRVFADLVDEAWTGDQAALLERLFPEATARELGIALESRRTAAAIISRACLLRGAGNTAERLIVAKLLGVTEERIRQLGNLEWRLASFLPKTTTGQIRGMH